MDWRDRLEGLKTTENNSKKLIEFLESRGINGKKGGVINYCWALIPFANFFREKDFNSLERGDINSYVATLNEPKKMKIRRVWNGKEIIIDHERRLGKESIRLVKTAIKTLMRWLNDGEIPISCKDLVIGMGESRIKSENELITLDEFKSLLAAASHPRDKAILSVLMDSGCRAGELLGMRIKDVSFEDEGALIHVDGKTGHRSIPLTYSTHSLRHWMDNHPEKNNLEAYIFFSTKGTSDKHLTVAGLDCLIRKLKRKAGITKRIYPHLFRHTCMTNLEKEGKIMGLAKNKFAGWSDYSKMNAIYSKLSDTDIKKLRWGKRRYEMPQHDKKCTKCGHINRLESGFCERCFMPLDPEMLAEIDERNRQKALKLDEMKASMEQMRQLQPLIKQMLKIQPMLEKMDKEGLLNDIVTNSIKSKI